MQLAKKALPKSQIWAEHGLKIVLIFIGNFMCSVAFNGFFIPNKLLSGGVGGISIMLYYLTKIPTGLIIFLINVPIFLIGARIIDEKFSIYSFISMLSFSFYLGATQGIEQYIKLDDVLLASIFGGILNGLGMGLLFSNRISQGGMDIIAAVFKRKYNINIGTALMGVNTLIVALSSTLFGLKPAMYTFIAMYIAYRLVDKVQECFRANKTAVIISDKSDELAKAIFDKLHRGVTFLQGEGAFTKCNKKVIYCIVTSTQVGKLKEIIEQVDPNAFVTINNLQEVKGTGFKSIGI